MKKIKVESLNGKEENIDVIFKKYLEICNKAIEKHKDDFLYKGIMNATEALVGDHPIDLAIYDDKPKGAYSLTFKNKKLEYVNCPSEIEKAWRVNLSYLKKVVENPDKYIDHPEKLDLDWLKSRMGF